MIENILSFLEWVFLVLLILTAIFDIRIHKIMPFLVYSMFFASTIKIGFSIVNNGVYFTSLWSALISCFITTFLFWLMYRFSHGIGAGDVKLMAAVSLFYGIRGISFIVMVSMLLVSIIGMILIIKDHCNLKAELPFAPFVAVAAILREFFILVGI